MPLSFTTLPLEIRNMIYSHVFHHESITIRSTPQHWFFISGPHERSVSYYQAPDPFLALLHTCQQISDEAAAYFYHNTTFCGEWPRLRAFITGIGACRRDQIRSVEILYTNLQKSVFDDDRVFELLGRLPSLRRVRIATSCFGLTRLQDGHVPRCVLKLAANVEICVHDLDLDRSMIIG